MKRDPDMTGDKFRDLLEIYVEELHRKKKETKS